MNAYFKKTYLFILFFIFIFILFLPKPSLAAPVYCHTQCGEQVTCGSTSYVYCRTCYTEYTSYPCCPCCTQYTCSGSWTVYRANTSGCDPVIEKGRCWSVCSGPGSNCCSCGGCTLECGEWETCEDCGSWQLAERACVVTSIGLGNPDCKCRGECVAAPTGLQEYQTPNSSMLADTPAKLPVKLDWNDVPGWQGGWSGAGSNMQAYADCQRNNVDTCWREVREAWQEENPDRNFCRGRHVQEYKACLDSKCEEEEEEVEECETICPAIDEGECYDKGEFVQSYKIEITGDLRNCEDGSDMSSYSEVLYVSEFFAPCHCFYKSNRTYTWRVRACCGPDGETECGEWSTRTFTTSMAPEPIAHYDPDWAGPGRAEPNWNTAIHEGFPVGLSWCEVEEAVTYIIQAYENGTPYCPTILCPYCPGCEMLFHPEGLATHQGTTGFYFDLDSFTKETLYRWKIATCFNEEGTDCSEFGQLWSFYGFTDLAKVELLYPENGGCVNFHSQLEWLHVGGARSYRYRIKEVPALQNVLATTTTPRLGDIWNNLSLNTTYTWKVKACWDDEGNDCEDDTWSDERQFTTAGASPTGLDVTEKDPDDGKAVIPIKLNWDDMPCAASYRYELTGIVDGVTPSSNLTVKYDPAIQHPRQNTEYSFRVWTCAKSGGEECGSETPLVFTTFNLKAPQNPHPPDGGEFFTYEYYLNWRSVLGGAFYQYEVTNDATGETIGPNIVESSNAFIDTSKMELGAYTWLVKACLDEDCDHYGPAGNWTFELIEGGVPGGLVPCGRYANNPATPWNERDACGVEHIFIMIYLIISYVLWKLIPIVLVLLTIASAIIFYFSGQLGIPNPTAQVKSLWKAVGIGLLVAFLAWIITSVILGLLGYKVGIFGTWWILDF